MFCAFQLQLQVAVAYRRFDLIIHPVLEELIRVKWQKFGRSASLWLLYSCVLILYSLKFDWLIEVWLIDVFEPVIKVSSCVKNSLFIFTPCCPHHFHPIHWDQTTIIVCQSLGSRPAQVQELFTLVPHLFGTTSRCLSIQPIQLLPLRNIWRHIFWTWPFPHRYRHARWPVDITELFPRFCFWTLIQLSHHWAWLRQGYWHYRNSIDWLIDQSHLIADCLFGYWVNLMIMLGLLLYSESTHQIPGHLGNKLKYNSSLHTLYHAQS